MSAYEELQQYVAAMSEQSFQQADMLMQLTDQIKACAVYFENLTATTRDGSASTVKACFSEANRQLLIAARVLWDAGKAGSDWCGLSQPTLTLTRRKR